MNVKKFLRYLEKLKNCVVGDFGFCVGIGIFWVNLRDFGYIFVENLKITPQNTLFALLLEKLNFYINNAKTGFWGGVYIFGLLTTKIPLFFNYENLIRIPA